MYKLFLAIALIFGSDLLQAGIVRDVMGVIEHRRAIRIRMQQYGKALPALKNMTKIELNLPAVRALNDFDVGFVIGDKEVTANVLVELMVREYNLRVLALTQGMGSRLAEREAEGIVDFLENKAMTLDVRFAPKGESALSDSDALLKQYVLKLGEYSACKDFVCFSGSMLGWKPLLKLMLELGTDMTMAELIPRFYQRWWLTAGSFSSIIFDVLNRVPLNQTQLERMQEADLKVDWDISSHVIIPKLGHTLSPGLVVQAKIYEFAARVMALVEKEKKDLVELSLSLIMNMKKNPDDNIIMKVSTSEDSYPMRLDKNSLEEIAALYRQQVN